MIQPIRDLILVLPDKEKDKTSSGIYLTGEAKEKPQKGTVISTGPQVTEVSTGDHIIYGKYSGNEIEIDSVNYLIFREEDVLGKLEKDIK